MPINDINPLIDAPLMPSLVQIRTTMEDTLRNDYSSSPVLFLASSGTGDLHLIRMTNHTQKAQPLAHPIHPLRPRAPLQGVRSFQLLSAMQLPGTNELIVVLWAVRRGDDAVPAACEIYAMTLTYFLPTQEQASSSHAVPAMHVVDVQLLHRSSMAPHGALCNPHSGGILIASAPLNDNEGNAATIGTTRIVNNNTTLVPSGIENLVLNSEMGRKTLEGSTIIDDEDRDDLSPRTLQAVAARFSHLTSENLITDEDLPRNQYADLFKESGPDGAGEMGGEPLCTLVCYKREQQENLVSQEDKTDQNQAEGTPTAAPLENDPESTELNTSNPLCIIVGDEPPPPGRKKNKFQIIEKILCHPHRLLGCQIVRNALRLSLTDDVDCAVVDIAASKPKENEERNVPLPGQATGFSINHVASIPALAYVAAGKIQRKFLLAGPTEVTSKVAAVLVEARQYSYVYCKVDPGDMYGQQAVVDMGLESGSGVLGAALVGGDSSGGEKGNEQQLLILGMDKLLSYSL